MDATPLPISLTDIDAYLRSSPLQINRGLFESVIFALDDSHLADLMKQEVIDEGDEEE